MCRPSKPDDLKKRIRGHNSSFVKVTGSRVQERRQALLLMAYIMFLFQATHNMEPFTNPFGVIVRWRGCGRQRKKKKATQQNKNKTGGDFRCII